MSHKNFSLSRLKNPVYLFATGFGTGYLRPGPGTFGTLAFVPVYLILQQFSLLVYAGVTVILFVLGVWACHQITSEINEHDHSSLVIDEGIGILITLFTVPLDWKWVVAGVLLFRLFDIWKPWPASLADKKVSGGLGVILDDVIAGLYAWSVLQGIIMMSVLI